MSYYILQDKKPIPVDDVIVWAKWFETHERQVAYTEIGDVRISTVFLGINYAMNGEAPLLFETMVFGGEHDGHSMQYRTWVGAESGHKKIVEMVEEKNK